MPGPFDDFDNDDGSLLEPGPHRMRQVTRRKTWFTGSGHAPTAHDYWVTEQVPDMMFATNLSKPRDETR